MAATLASSSTACQQLGSLNRAELKAFGASNGARTVAVFKKGAAAAKKTVKKVVKGKNADRPLWFPGAKSPPWLDGSLAGDYGFDPLGLAKPPEYLQFELDSLDQNLAKNEAGQVLGTRVNKAAAEIGATAFQPYTEVFSINRFRENEVIHGRWAMLGVLGALSVEALTGVTWQDAGKVELEQGSSYLGLPLPFNVATLTVIEVLVIGYIEFQRNAELEPEKRLYPGGKYFDPLGLAADPEKAENLKLAELKHARLAMLAALGFAAQAAATGKGPLDNWVTHLADPLHTTIFDTLS